MPSGRDGRVSKKESELPSRFSIQFVLHCIQSKSLELTWEGIIPYKLLSLRVNFESPSDQNLYREVVDR